MRITLIAAPRAPDEYKCSRFDGYCPKERYHEGPQGTEYTATGELGSSSSAAARAPAPLLAAALALAAVCTRAFVLRSC